MASDSQTGGIKEQVKKRIFKNLLQASASQKRKDGFDHTVSDAVKFVVQRYRHIGIAGNQFDFVSDLWLRMWRNHFNRSMLSR